MHCECLKNNSFSVGRTRVLIDLYLSSHPHKRLIMLYFHIIWGVDEDKRIKFCGALSYSGDGGCVSIGVKSDSLCGQRENCSSMDLPVWGRRIS